MKTIQIDGKRVKIQIVRCQQLSPPLRLYFSTSHMRSPISVRFVDIFRCIRPCGALCVRLLGERLLF